MLGKYQEAPSPVYWKVMKEGIRYLIHTTDYRIYLPFGQQAVLQERSDADWERHRHKRRYCSGYLITMDSDPVLCKSRLQKITDQ